VLGKGEPERGDVLAELGQLAVASGQRVVHVRPLVPERSPAQARAGRMRRGGRWLSGLAGTTVRAARLFLLGCQRRASIRAGLRASANSQAWTRCFAWRPEWW
jgi:hypothetical protein